MKGKNSWFYGRHEWCFKAMEDMKFKNSVTYSNKKRNFIIRGITILLIGILFEIFSLIGGFILLTPLINILLAAILMAGGVYELMTGVLGYPMISC